MASWLFDLAKHLIPSKLFRTHDRKATVKHVFSSAGG